jgi:hypothetical protein
MSEEAGRGGNGEDPGLRTCCGVLDANFDDVPGGPGGMILLAKARWSRFGRKKYTMHAYPKKSTTKKMKMTAKMMPAPGAWTPNFTDVREEDGLAPASERARPGATTALTLKSENVSSLLSQVAASFKSLLAHPSCQCWELPLSKSRRLLPWCSGSGSGPVTTPAATSTIAVRNTKASSTMVTAGHL